MKNFLFTALLLFSLRQANAQTKIYFLSSHDPNRPTVAHLDSLYKSAIHFDTSFAVFKIEKDKELLINAYENFIREMNRYLNENGFRWSNPTRIFNRFYMNKYGNVEYYIYKILGSGAKLDEVSRQRFESLMSSFFKTHEFGVTATEPLHNVVLLCLNNQITEVVD